MDPCWRFPHEELDGLFKSLSLTESMLIALEHLQVSYVTINRTRLHKFRRNVISFPQDPAALLGRLGALRQYRVGDRVNSCRGPHLEGEGDDRGPKAASAAGSALQHHVVEGS
jgi:hypothetical protein